MGSEAYVCAATLTGWDTWQVVRKFAFAFFGISNGTGAYRITRQGLVLSGVQGLFVGIQSTWFQLLRCVTIKWLHTE